MICHTVVQSTATGLAGEDQPGEEERDERDDRDRDDWHIRGLLVLPRVLLQQLRHREPLLLGRDHVL